jgi:hypothetical protein
MKPQKIITKINPVLITVAKGYCILIFYEDNFTSIVTLLCVDSPQVIEDLTDFPGTISVFIEHLQCFIFLIFYQQPSYFQL